MGLILRRFHIDGDVAIKLQSTTPNPDLRREYHGKPDDIIIDQAYNYAWTTAVHEYVQHGNKTEFDRVAGLYQQRVGNFGYSLINLTHIGLVDAAIRPYMIYPSAFSSNAVDEGIQ